MDLPEKNNMTATDLPVLYFDQKQQATFGVGPVNKCRFKVNAEIYIES